jgi:hypothetical protein
MINILRPEQIWQPKRGAPLGNRNARKHGRSDRGARELRRRIAAYRRRARALRAAIEKALENGWNHQ